MKNKASLVALNDLLEKILKPSLLSDLIVKKDEDKEEDDDDEDKEEMLDEVMEDTEEDTEDKPKVIEFSVSRSGKLPGSKSLEDELEGLVGKKNKKRK